MIQDLLREGNWANTNELATYIEDLANDLADAAHKFKQGQLDAWGLVAQMRQFQTAQDRAFRGLPRA